MYKCTLLFFGIRVFLETLHVIKGRKLYWKLFGCLSVKQLVWVL